MKAAFIAWAMRTPGITSMTEAGIRNHMDRIDTVIGTAYAAWRAAWRAKK